MHDINGKTLHVGDEITAYAFGLCKIASVEAEDNAERQGAMVHCTNAKGERIVPFRLGVAEAVKVRTWKELATEALAVQDACNLSGVVTSFSHIIREVRARLETEGRGSTDQISAHPVCVLFSDKIASLTLSESKSMDAFRWAYDVKGGV